MLHYFKSVKFFMVQKVENMLLEAIYLYGRCHGHGIAIKVSLWLCDFYGINFAIFWHSEKVINTFFYRAGMISMLLVIKAKVEMEKENEKEKSRRMTFYLHLAYK